MIEHELRFTCKLLDDGAAALLDAAAKGQLATREQIDALSDRYRCVSVDWPGHAREHVTLDQGKGGVVALSAFSASVLFGRFLVVCAHAV